MAEPPAAIERRGRTMLVRLRRDLVVGTAGSLAVLLRTLGAREDLDEIRLDFSEVRRVDSAAVAVVELARRSGRSPIALDQLGDRERALFDVFSAPRAGPSPPRGRARALERVGDRVIAAAADVRAFAVLVADTARDAVAVLLRRARLPAGALAGQVLAMGADAVLIIGLLSFLLGMSIAFQGALQLRQLGAEVLVSDLVSLAMVRELGPLVAAVIVTGRTGAAIAAELGTMKVNSEIDALTAMGVSPTRYLVVPRLAALTIVQPILALLAMFVGIAGGAVVAQLVAHVAPSAFWSRSIELLDLGDFARGLTKSVAFAWIIGLTGAHLGLRARRDAGGVGMAATRAVVAAIFCIIVFDSVFESIATLRSL